MQKKRKTLKSIREELDVQIFELEIELRSVEERAYTLKAVLTELKKQKENI